MKMRNLQDVACDRAGKSNILQEDEVSVKRKKREEKNEVIRKEERSSENHTKTNGYAEACKRGGKCVSSGRHDRVDG